jgi:alanine-alpha-ketoisovalerate/valine-pyruvate aminotransferase
MTAGVVGKIVAVASCVRIAELGVVISLSPARLQPAKKIRRMNRREIKFLLSNIPVKPFQL